jgi:hypothetical protein
MRGGGAMEERERVEVEAVAPPCDALLRKRSFGFMFDM